jgi:hypothetical protein
MYGFCLRSFEVPGEGKTDTAVPSLSGGRGYGVKRAGKAISCLFTCFFSSICCYLQDNVMYRFCLRSFEVPGEGKTDTAVPPLSGGRGYGVKRAGKAIS